MSHRLLKLSRPRIAAPIAIAGVLLAGLSGPPANAESSAADPVQIGLGNGITASIDPATSKVSLTTGTPLVWDPNLIGIDRYGYGSGWALKDTPLVDRYGRVAFYFPALGEFFQMDLSSPTGLDDYPYDDVLLSENKTGEQVPARSIPGEPDIPAQPYGFSMQHFDAQHSATVTEYYRELPGGGYDLYLAAAIDRTTGKRTDWEYTQDPTQLVELTRIVDQDGKTTKFERIDDVVRRISPPSAPPVTLWVTDGKTSRYITAAVRTSFDVDRSFGGPEFGYWLVSQDVSTDAATSFWFRWDPARPGHVTEVERRRPDENREVVYPLP